MNEGWGGLTVGQIQGLPPTMKTASECAGNSPADKPLGGPIEYHPDGRVVRSSCHYGPEWAWDQTRPEAIRAHRRLEEFHRKLLAAQRSRSGARETEDTAQHSAATHFRKAARHLRLGVAAVLGWR